ncbi:MAG: 5'-methylthioadenosine nucleosidase [Planctomycetaceae bacterium]
MIDAHSPKWVIACGYSGALRDGTAVGDVVMADAVVDTHGRELRVDLNMSAEGQKRLHVGRFLTSDEMVRSVADKRALGEKHDAIAVDMESLPVAQVCRETGTRFLAVRAISDDLTADLPAEVVSVLGDTGSFRLGAMLGAVWKRPGSVKEIWRLREQTMIASDRLAKFLQGVVVQLHEAD